MWYLASSDTHLVTCSTSLYIFNKGSGLKHDTKLKLNMYTQLMHNYKQCILILPCLMLQKYRRCINFS